MEKRIVFLGGVHGVGKTYFCNKLSENLDIEHVTASSLIGGEVKQTKNKAVLGIERNQLILVEGLSHYQTDKCIILLDGHFCLIEASSNIKNVPLDTFKAISPCAIILLKDNPSKIAMRLSKRDEREYSSDLISILQDREIKWASFVSATLNVPIKIIEAASDYEQPIEEISLFLKVGAVNAHSS